MNKINKAEYKYLLPHEFTKRLEKAPIAFLPLGTLEWHGAHLPLGADGIQAEELFIRLSEKIGGIVFPMLFLGPDRKEIHGEAELYGMDICPDYVGEETRYPQRQLVGSCYYIEEEDFRIIIETSVKQIARAGFKILVTHGHGPSIWCVENSKEELEKKYNIKIITCVEDGNPEIAGYMSDHASKNETSITMALYPELVEIDNLPKDRWPDGIDGLDPRKYASICEGKKLIEYHVNRMSKILIELLEG